MLSFFSSYLPPTPKPQAPGWGHRIKGFLCPLLNLLSPICYFSRGTHLLSSFYITFIEADDSHSFISSLNFLSELDSETPHYFSVHALCSQGNSWCYLLLPNGASNILPHLSRGWVLHIWIVYLISLLPSSPISNPLANPDSSPFNMCLESAHFSKCPSPR